MTQPPVAERQQAVRDAIANIKKIVQSSGLNRPALTEVLAQVKGLAARKEFWTEAEFPPSEPPERQARYAAEPLVLKLLYVEERLRATLRHLEALQDFRGEGPSFAPRPPAYERAEELLADVELIRRSLRARPDRQKRQLIGRAGARLALQRPPVARPVTCAGSPASRRRARAHRRRPAWP